MVLGPFEGFSTSVSTHFGPYYMYLMMLYACLYLFGCWNHSWVLVFKACVLVLLPPHLPMDWKIMPMHQQSPSLSILWKKPYFKWLSFGSLGHSPKIHQRGTNAPIPKLQQRAHFPFSKLHAKHLNYKIYNKEIKIHSALVLHILNCSLSPTHNHTYFPQASVKYIYNRNRSDVHESNDNEMN